MKLLATAMLAAAVVAREATAATVVSTEVFGILEVMKVTGAVPHATGSSLSADKRTVYLFTDDKPAQPSNTVCATPTYSTPEDPAGPWPLVFVEDLTLASGIPDSACTSATFPGYPLPVLCCKVNNYGLMPMYQYQDDVSGSDAKGLGTGNWWTVDSLGGSPAPGSAPSSNLGETPIGGNPSSASCGRAVSGAAALAGLTLAWARPQQ